MATTLSQLKTRIRQRADKEDSTYIGDSELNSYVNASYAELYDLLVEAYEDYFVTGPTSFSLVSGDSGVYSLPSDFYKLKGVDFSSGGDWITLYPYNWNTRNSRDRTLVRAAHRDYERTYRIIGSNLRIEPDDDAVGDYRIWYVPAYTALSADTDELDSVITRNNWEEYIVIDAAIKILAKEESDASHLAFEKQEMLKRITRMSGDRDVDQPEVVSDVRGGDVDTMRFRY